MSVGRVVSDDELRDRLRTALREAGKPLPVKDLAVLARLSDGGALLLLRELAAAGEAIVVVEPGRPAPYLDHYAAAEPSELSDPLTPVAPAAALPGARRSAARPLPAPRPDSPEPLPVLSGVAW